MYLGDVLVPDIIMLCKILYREADQIYLIISEVLFWIGMERVLVEFLAASHWI